MSTPARPKRLPTYAYVTDEVAKRYADITEQGIYNLAPQEVFWQARYRYLEDHGYRLRPRYKPGWKPSWTGTNLNPTYCEDSILLRHYQVMDATRLSDGELVAIKFCHRRTQELHIAQYFHSIKDRANHCVPILDVLPDPHDPALTLMVMPYLRPCNDPEFGTVGDVIEFVDQTLEGLVFMHRHRIAHRDIAMANVMMDAKAIYPGGHHPIRRGYTPDALYAVSPLPRAGHNVRYIYIDFDLSERFPEGGTTYVLGKVGRDVDLPEASNEVPYDAFKADVFSLGNVYTKFFERNFQNVEFLYSLIELMKQRRPEDRPTAEEALWEWKKIRATLSDSLFRWRLVPKTEAPMERVVNDTVAVAWEGVYRLKEFVGLRGP
ncbi:kinase-like protein [Trametes coccinea BRFM310]|uniref:Kinase-like protein n=1 Tax=Trametes coccinea (strain BRFM310) TaxID=1353009 RepID=A0A1Y2IIG1_TRAC3|nr:kinase-like protein [Trametes coccinea BRFM310]